MGREPSSSVTEQVDRLVDGLREILGDNLRGVYLHGSLALGCFNPARSDIDVLAVVNGLLDVDTKLLLADLLLHVSCAPRPIELHVVTKAHLEDWMHPLPFDFHYGESHRDGYAFDPLEKLATMGATDPDLTAHVTIARQAGVTVVGPPADQIFPKVPFADYRDALGTDLQWARTVKSALYGILSPCRVWATLATGAVQSKATGAAWALEQLPDHLKPVVEKALASYTGNGEAIDVDEAQRQELLDYIEQRLRE